MKHAKTLLATLTLSALIPLAHAEPYIGGNYLYLDYSEGEIDVDLGALYLRGGFQFNEWAAVEARIGTGISDDSVDFYGWDADVEVNEIYGGYFVAGIPNSSMFYPYAVVGYTQGELEINVAGLSESDSDGDFSYGLGLDLRFTDSLAGNIEFMRYMDIDGGELDGFSAGIKYSFK